MAAANVMNKKKKKKTPPWYSIARKRLQSVDFSRAIERFRGYEQGLGLA